MSDPRYIPPGSRIVLVQPPLRDFYLTRHRMNALGLKLVHSVLIEAGYTVECLNFPRGGQAKNIPLPESLSFLTAFLIPGERGPLSGFPRFRRFGPDFGTAAETVLASKPDLVLIGLFAWAYGQDALDIAGALRSRAPGISIGIGGAGLSVDPKRFGESGFFDLLLIGEAEKVLPEWIAAGAPAKGLFGAVAPAESVLGMAATAEGLFGGGTSGDGPGEAPRGGSGAAGTASGDEPKPALAWVPQEGALSLSLSRGCPMRCSFCANRLVHGKRFRTVPLEKILSELDRIFEGQPEDTRRGDTSPGEMNRVRKIYFEDDNLSADADWFAALLSRLSRKFPGVRMSAENGIDYRFLDSNKLLAMYRAGFRRLNFSIASTDTGQLERQGRSGLLDRYLQLLGCTEEHGMEAVTYFIAGLPGEKPETTVRNLRYLRNLPTEVGISLYYPVPGIGGFEDPAAFREVPFQRALGSAAWPWGGGYTTAQLLTAFRLARLTNLMKNQARRERDGVLRQDNPGDEQRLRDEQDLLETVLRTRRLYTMVGKSREIREVKWADREMVESLLKD